MSKNTERIRRVADELGLNIESLEWQPIGKDFEMIGRSGGWIVNGEAKAHSTDELIQLMREHPSVIDHDYEEPEAT